MIIEHMATPLQRYTFQNELVDIVSDKGIVITFGYHSVSMGRKRGFSIDKILIMSHGGAIHDTIATIERKMN